MNADVDNMGRLFCENRFDAPELQVHGAPRMTGPMSAIVYVVIRVETPRLT